MSLLHIKILKNTYIHQSKIEIQKIKKIHKKIRHERERERERVIFTVINCHIYSNKMEIRRVKIKGRERDR